MGALDVLGDILGMEAPVSFEEFCTSPEYCNNKDIYRYWIEQEELLPDDCNELILDGSLGGGKSTFGDYYLAYRIYLLFHGGSPQTQLGLPENSDIYCLYFSVSLKMAQKSGFNLLYSIFKDCGWFKNNAPIDEEIMSCIRFKDKHFEIDFASGESHQIGLNVWGFILDEANFRGGVGQGLADEYSEVTDLYQQLIDRQVSRFSRADGGVDALAILISSASYQTSFSEQRAQAIKDSSRARRITVRKYEVTPERYSKEKFEVFVGCGNVKPCLIKDADHKARLLASIGLDGVGKDGSDMFQMVPINLKQQFEANIVLALMNHCGVAVGSTSSFMSNMEFLFNSYVDDIKPLFICDEVEASTGDDVELMSYFLPYNIENANNPHSIFLDLSLSGDTGSMTCFRYDGRDGRGYDIHTRVFSIRIMPPEFPNKTRIEKVKRFIIELSQYMNIVAFASDQFQSEGLRQEIQAELGLDNIRMSIDSTDVYHLHWLRGLVDERIRQTRDDGLAREVKEAVHDVKKHKVKKQTNSSDDVMQTNVGAFYLSDTIGKNYGNVDGLYDNGQLNLVSAKAVEGMLKKLGYKRWQ